MKVNQKIVVNNKVVLFMLIMLLFYVFFIIDALLIMMYDVFYAFVQLCRFINLNLILVVFITCFKLINRLCFDRVKLIGL